jgi:hypothetical protein
VYCDYDCTPYTPQTALPLSQQRIAILKRFSEGWSSEVHTALLLPFDLQILAQISTEVLSGRLSPHLRVAIPHLRVACDPMQINVIKDLIECISFVSKRRATLCRVTGIYSDINPPPRLRYDTGLHILPQLILGKSNLQFPSETSVPVNQSRGIAHLLQMRAREDVERGGWARSMWKHAIEMVINDLRRIVPLGRWKNLILLCWARKEYAFLYGKYLRVYILIDTA